MFNKLPKDKRPTLKETTVKISGAGGKILHSKGYGNFNLKIGPLEIQAQMIVANITDEILLGADILMSDTSGKADILLSQGKMILRGKTINLEQRFNPLPVRKVHLADSCVLPAESEVISEVFIDREEDDHEQPWIVEPCPLLAERYSVAMAATLVDTSTNVTVKVRLMNPFKEDLVLQQDTVIGYASQPDQIEERNITEDQLVHEATTNPR